MQDNISLDEVAVENEEEGGSSSIVTWIIACVVITAAMVAIPAVVNLFL